MNTGEGSAPNGNKLARKKELIQPMEFLVFQLGAEEYAIDIMKIQEIQQYFQPVHIANAPTFIAGVVEIHDVIIPLIDMRILFKFENIQYTKQTMVIILNLVEARVVGVIVDSVSDAVKIHLTDIKTTPEFAAIIHNAYIQGIGMVNDRALIILDIEKLLSVKELNELDKATSQSV